MPKIKYAPAVLPSSRSTPKAMPGNLARHRASSTNHRQTAIGESGRRRDNSSSKSSTSTEISNSTSSSNSSVGNSSQFVAPPATNYQATTRSCATDSSREISKKDLLIHSTKDWRKLPVHLKCRGRLSRMDPDGEDPVYQVEKIVRSKKQRGNIYYLVKWRGWSHEFNTWEESGNVSNLAKAYFHGLPLKFTTKVLLKTED